ncbi:MAG: hypothetical protein ACRCZ0_06590 [Cetobacterium sp.]
MVEIREDFCGMCMAVPIALAGAGIAGLSTREEYKKRKWIMIGIGVVVLIITLLLYLKYKNCSSCTF